MLPVDETLYNYLFLNLVNILNGVVKKMPDVLKIFDGHIREVCTKFLKVLCKVFAKCVLGYILDSNYVITKYIIKISNLQKEAESNNRNRKQSQLNMGDLLEQIQATGDI